MLGAGVLGVGADRKPDVRKSGRPHPAAMAPIHRIVDLENRHGYVYRPVRRGLAWGGPSGPGPPRGGPRGLRWGFGGRWKGPAAGSRAAAAISRAQLLQTRSFETTLGVVAFICPPVRTSTRPGWGSAASAAGAAGKSEACFGPEGPGSGVQVRTSPRQVWGPTWVWPSTVPLSLRAGAGSAAGALGWTCRTLGCGAWTWSSTNPRARCPQQEHTPFL